MGSGGGGRAVDMGIEIVRLLNHGLFGVFGGRNRKENYISYFDAFVFLWEGPIKISTPPHGLLQQVKQIFR